MLTMKNLLPDSHFHHAPHNSPTQNEMKLLHPHRHPRVYEIGDLKHRITLPHGTFFFGPDSHHVEVDPTYKPSFNSIQQELLDDEIIDVKEEKARCARYSYQLVDEVNPKRRRLFLGALLGDDSMEVLRAVGTEAYNIFHTVSLVESNSTLTISPRKWKYHDRENPSERLNTLYQLFGPKTKVSVEYYVSTLKRLFGRTSDLSFENCQREGSSHRWALNGMGPDDIGIISDADETFTRDYLRAMQICDVPAFQPNQDCSTRQLASALVFECSPNCIKNKRWIHPNAILGECVENVGDSSVHPPAKREYKDRHGLRAYGHGAGGNYSAYWSENGLEPNSVYPLSMVADIRLGLLSGAQITGKGGSPTGYHFHNFFSSSDAIHVKYHTYGHSVRNALEKPVWELHKDLQLAVDCANGVHREAHDYIDYSESIEGPIYYLNDDARSKRHELWQSIVKEEEELMLNSTSHHQ
ncbi:hypothetical protein ACHAXH_002903 [Discostella pseudostelligera]